jgi:hypothetical protein
MDSTDVWVSSKLKLPVDVARLTAADLTPGSRDTLFSTAAAQAAHLSPLRLSSTVLITGGPRWVHGLRALPLRPSRLDRYPIAGFRSR